MTDTVTIICGGHTIAEYHAALAAIPSVTAEEAERMAARFVAEMERGQAKASAVATAAAGLALGGGTSPGSRPELTEVPPLAKGGWSPSPLVVGLALGGTT